MTRKPVNDNRRSVGVRVVPSPRMFGMFETQVSEAGRWRANSVHRTREQAKEAAADIIVARVASRIHDEFPA